MRIGTLKESYAADEALFDTRTQKVWLALFFLALLIFPFTAGEYWLYITCLVAIHVISTTGLNILTGFTGLVSLARLPSWGVAAYTVAVLEARLGTPTLINLIAAGFVTAGVAPSWACRAWGEGALPCHGDHRRSFILHFVFANWTSVTQGVSGIKCPARLGAGL